MVESDIAGILSIYNSLEIVKSPDGLMFPEYKKKMKRIKIPFLVRLINLFMIRKYKWYECKWPLPKLYLVKTENRGKVLVCNPRAYRLIKYDFNYKQGKIS